MRLRRNATSAVIPFTIEEVARHVMLHVETVEKVTFGKVCMSKANASTMAAVFSPTICSITAACPKMWQVCIHVTDNPLHRELGTASKCLQVLYTPQDYTSETKLKDALQDSLDKWNLNPSKLTAFTTDNEWGKHCEGLSASWDS